jgi:hypothetical protein
MSEDNQTGRSPRNGPGCRETYDFSNCYIKKKASPQPLIHAGISGW